MKWEPTESYWENKIISYFHDPIDKVLNIKSHENRSKKLLNIIIGTESLSDDIWKMADAIASSFERGTLPSYSKEKGKSGAVDFLEYPLITHPTSGEENHLNIELPFDKENVNEIFEDLKTQIEELSNSCENKKDRNLHQNLNRKDILFKKFTALHLLLRFKLAYENVGGLGNLWHRIPADTRFPDHSIWQHNAITSAIASCINFNENYTNNIGLMVFSINPVQQFISKARKLRDYWIGSIILSWLSFEGIIWVIENLGCDHIIYPSLIDQSLVYEYLKNKDIMPSNFEKYLLNKENQIASFPNKYLFFVPFDNAKEIGEEIKKRINFKWLELKQKLLNLFINEIKIDEKIELEKLFNRQFNDYWDLSYSSVNLISDNEDIFKDLTKIFKENQFELQKDLSNKFSVIYKELNEKDKNIKTYYPGFDNVNLSSFGTFYSVSHSLVQKLLATTKNIRKVKRNYENGEKCMMCGEFEVVNTFDAEQKTNFQAKDYMDNIKSLWRKIKEKYESIGIKDNERLCSICLTKRLFNRIIEKDKNHILYNAIKDADSFPQTSEIALYDYFKDNKIESKEEKKILAKNKYENKEDSIDNNNRDSYYAILKMDGDRMGDLINGETIGSTWEKIMHPQIVERLENDVDLTDFKSLKSSWKEILKNKRIVTPSIHMAISESLGDFANYGVAKIIKENEGVLIYAGGDDVLAVLPLSNVLKASFEIQKYYVGCFKEIEFKDEENQNKDKEILNKEKLLLINDIDSKDINLKYKPKKGKLSINLGYSQGISISAGILICHYKENLSKMIKKAEEVLEKAKYEGRRNSLAICLKKRSGHERYFITKWPREDESKFDEFSELSIKMEGNISKSLIYNLEYHKDGLNALITNKDKVELRLKNYIKSLVEKSGKNSKILKEMKNDEKENYLEEISKNITKLILIKEKNDNFKISIEPLIIASFLVKKEREKKEVKNGK